MRFLSHSQAWKTGLELVGVGVLSATIWVTWVHNNVPLLWNAGDLFELFVAVSFAGFLFCLVPGILLRTWVQPFWSGVSTLLLLYGGEWWFRAPPPHIVNETLRGSVWVGGVLLGLVVGLGWATRHEWVRRAGWCVGVGSLLWGVPFDWIGNDDERSSPGPNVLLISVDTWRADHVGVLSDGDSFTPVFDRRASAAAPASAHNRRGSRLCGNQTSDAPRHRRDAVT